MPKFIMTQAERDKRRAERRSARFDAMFPEDASEGIDVFRNMLARKIAMLIGDEHKSWHNCPERACRRQRACMAPRIQCSNAPPEPPSTPEQDAQALAEIHKLLRQKLEEHRTAM